MNKWLGGFKEKLSGKKESGAGGLDPEYVRWAYRLFLDRESESEELVLDRARALQDSRELRSGFMQSEEYRIKNPNRPMALSGDEPAMVIEDVLLEGDLNLLFTHIQQTWQHLGETEPYWSVLTAERFLQVNLQQSNALAEFYEKGRGDADRIFKTLERNGLDVGGGRSCLEYGCGLGRVTRWLADRFEVVYGFDISSAHLKLARANLEQLGAPSVDFRQICAVRDLEMLPKVDLVYSVIVLQHNPPPLIGYMIQKLLNALNPGGVALFQVPTYKLGYRFTLLEYLASAATRRELEMHVFPQKRVFELIRQTGCQVIEVLEDGWTGGLYGEISNTFLVQKGHK